MKMKKVSRKALAMMAVAALMGSGSVVGAADLTSTGGGMSILGPVKVEVTASGDQVAASLKGQTVDLNTVQTNGGKFSADSDGNVKGVLGIFDKVNAESINAGSGSVGGVVMKNGEVDSDVLYVGNGALQASEEGMYSNVGSTQLQVRDDYVGMSTYDNVTKAYTGIGISNDGVDLMGDVHINDNIIFSTDGSFAMGNGAFSVTSDGELSIGYGKAMINKYGVITASDMYIGSATDDNRVVTKGELGQTVGSAVIEATEGAVKWDKDVNGNYTNSINGVEIENGNVNASKVTTGELDVNGNADISGNLNVGGSLTVGGETVATGADVSGIKAQLGVDENGSYKTIDNGATDVITGINKNTTDIKAVQTTVGSGTLNNGAADLTSGINQNYAQIQQNSNAISSLGSRVSDLGDEIDNVGAISAALAGLHPLDYNGTGSKFQLSAAVGTYDGTQAAAIGGFYHFNQDIMLSLGGATSFDGDNKTAANLGVTFRIGEGASSKAAASDDIMARLEAMDQKIAALEQENKDLKDEIQKAAETEKA